MYRVDVGKDRGYKTLRSLPRELRMWANVVDDGICYMCRSYNGQEGGFVPLEDEDETGEVRELFRNTIERILDKKVKVVIT
jgi:hypothetical protein